jgi:hypothetical protein
MNMKMKLKFNSAGQVSKLLLVLAVIVLVAVVITYLIIKMATPPPRPIEPIGPDVVLPIYEQTLGDIKYIFIEARNMGDTLKGSESRNPQWQKDLKTTDRFIELTVGVQNKGKENIPERVWNIENIVDSEGRNFVPSSESDVKSWLPELDLCEELLKPEFEATPCTKIYEVSNISTGLKVRVVASKFIDGSYQSDKKDEALIDLIVR